LKSALSALALSVAALSIQAVTQAETPPSKRTLRVPMRDGTRLATDVWLPPGDGPWPVVLERTPFNRGNVRGDRFARLGMALVTQDTRGRGDSEGKASPFLDDGWGKNPDGADTVAWIRRQPWCDGKIATTGLPPPQLLLAGAGPPGVVGQYAGIAPISLYHYAFYQNGVFRQGWEG
jgi:putative CocE/NonD family hydrolase